MPLNKQCLKLNGVSYKYVFRHLNYYFKPLVFFKKKVEGIENWPLYVHYARKKSKDEIFAFHGCSFSSVQSIIHYGLHSNYSLLFYKLMNENFLPYLDGQPENSIHLTRDALSSHIRNTRRSTDGKYYMFVVRLSKKLVNQESINLSNEDAHLTLLTHLIVYQRQIVV